MLKFILAIDNSNLVGSTNSKFGLAWHYPEDLKFYQSQTTNHINIMGHTTYKQIGKALPNRTTLVMSRNNNLKLSDADVINSKEEVLKIQEKTDEDIFICGGVQIFKLFADVVEEIIVTRIAKEYNGDVYFPELNDILLDFELISEKQGETQELKFQVWKRK